MAKKLDELVADHEENFAESLGDLVGGQHTEDIRNDTDGIDEGGLPPLRSWPSLAALSAEAGMGDDLKEAKLADRRLELLLDSTGHFYLLAKGEDVLVDKHTVLGGVGGGTLQDAGADRGRSIPWALPKEDKTVLVLQGDEEREVTGTLYALARDLESRSTGALTLTSFGRLMPRVEAGNHGYSLEFPPSAPGHVRKSFELQPGGKRGFSHHNAFSALTVDETMQAGALLVTWKVAFEPVGNTLRPIKPVILSGRRVACKLGQPVLLAGPAGNAAA
jgi:hypothetical protein